MTPLRTITLLFAFATQVLVPKHATAAPQVKKRAKAPDRVLKPFLWQIEGDTPNYIFGTVHVADPRALKLHPQVEKAFVNSDAAFFEIDFRRSADQVRAITLRDNEKLEDTLPADLIQRLDARINKYQPGYRNQFRAKPI
ncbi:MAG: TraB/GumN family protein, partial [Planctomycetaceae bacterium]